MLCAPGDPPAPLLNSNKHGKDDLPTWAFNKDLLDIETAGEIPTTAWRYGILDLVKKDSFRSDQIPEGGASTREIRCCNKLCSLDKRPKKNPSEAKKPVWAPKFFWSRPIIS